MKLQRATWVTGLTDELIGRRGGADTFERGRDYADRGAVVVLVEGREGQTLLATVRGSGRQHYQTFVERQGDVGPGVADWRGRCSCPVQRDCKHAAAALLVARQSFAPERRLPRWEEVLGPLVRNGHPPESGLPLALQVSLSRTTPQEPPDLALLPMREGRSKAWVRQGAGWSDIVPSWDRHGTAERFCREHREVVGELLTLWRMSSGTPAYYGYAVPPKVTLGALGPGVWELLRRAADARMPLLAGDSLSAVRLEPGRMDVALDVRRGEDGGLALRPDLPLEEGAGVILIGTPAHGLGILREGALTLHQLTGVLPDLLRRLLLAGELEVPAEDADRFLTLYYPSLARQAPMRSADLILPTPEDVEPGLTLDVRVGEGHAIQLEWGFRYPVPTVDGTSREVRVPLHPTPEDPPRDRATEARLVESLTELSVIPSLVRRDLSGVLVPLARVSLSGTDTVTFATQVLPRLEERDDVQVTVHGELAGYAEAQNPPVVHLETADRGHDGDWFDLSVHVTIDGEEVPFGELFAALVRGDDVLLLESGTWFSLDHPELDRLRELIEEARELADPQTQGLRISRYQAGLWEELVSLGVVGRQSRRWSEAVTGLLSLGRHDPAAVPEGLRSRLRPYQEEGYQWLAQLWDSRLGGVLADDMGLGKTLQTLALVQRAKELGELEAPVLVVAPASVIATWVDEAARFCPDLRVRSVTATAARRGAELAEVRSEADLVVTSYNLLRLEAEDYRAPDWSLLVLDEAQFVKNHRSKTYQVARTLGVPRTLAITGTPLENSLMDLWSMLSLAAPGLFADPDAFTERYRRPIEGGQGAEQLVALRQRVRPFLLRRTKELVAPELPEKQEQTLRVALTPAHQRIYSRHLQRERQRVLGMLTDIQRNRVAIFRSLTLLRQLSLDPSLVDSGYVGKAPSAKVASLLEQVDAVVAEGHRALVFSTFTGFLGLVRQALEARGVSYSYLDGSTRRRPEVIEAFRTGDDPVFLISLKAGGFGLNLTEADYVFLLDPWWNPAAEAQAVDRTHRIGQDKPVMVYRLVSQDTIEEKVVALQQRKRDLFDRVVDEGEFASGAISAEDIRELLGA